MDWLKHMVFWLPSALINGESKTYKDCQLSKKGNTVLSQQHDLEWKRHGGADDTEKKNHSNGV